MDLSITTLRPSLVAFLTLVAVSAPAIAQQAGTVAPARDALRVTAGGGVTTGFLDFRSDTVTLQANLGQVPTSTVGVQGWIDEFAGFDAAYQIGIGGSLSLPLQTLEGAQEIAFVIHKLQGAFHYRWFLSDEPSSIALGVRAGFMLHSFIPSPHAPTIVLSTTYAGPTLGLTTDIPVTETIGVGADAHLVYPYNVREFPDTSGIPKGPKGFSLGAGPWYALYEGIYLKARWDYNVFAVSYDGRGNRGLGNVTNGSSFDGFHTVQLLIDWLP